MYTFSYYYHSLFNLNKYVPLTKYTNIPHLVKISNTNTQYKQQIPYPSSITLINSFVAQCRCNTWLRFVPI